MKIKIIEVICSEITIENVRIYITLGVLIFANETLRMMSHDSEIFYNLPGLAMSKMTGVWSFARVKIFFIFGRVVRRTSKMFGRAMNFARLP